MVHLIIDQSLEQVLQQINQVLEKDMAVATTPLSTTDEGTAIYIIAQDRPHALPEEHSAIKKHLSPPAMRPPYPIHITRREREVLQLIEQGYTTREISEMLFRSKHTIDTHRKNLLGKLEAKNAVELINNARAWAIL